MTHEEFGKLLNEKLEALPSSKNETIRLTEINRSTFFKFLNGRRFPTAEQMDAILDRAGFSAQDQAELRRAYDDAHYSYAAYNSIEIVRQCMESVSQVELARKYGEMQRTADAGTPREAAAMAGVTAEQPAAAGGEATDFFRSQDLSSRHAIEYALLRYMQMSLQSGNSVYAFLPLGETGTMLHYRSMFSQGAEKMHLLFHFSDTVDDMKKHNSPNFFSLLPLALTVSCQIWFFYGPGELTDGAGLLYPYYVISDSGVMMISATTDRAFFTSDRAVQTAFRDGYQRALKFSEEITARNRSLQATQASIMKNLRNSKKQLYMVGYAPCMTLLATPELIRTMIPALDQEGLGAYCRALQAAGPIEIVSEEGLHSMVRHSALEEWGIRLTAPREVVHNILLGLRRRLGRTLFIADSSRISVPEQWLFFIFPGTSVTLIPQSEEDASVAVYEKNVLNAFNVSFDKNMDYFVLKERTAEKILDTYLAQTE